MVLSSLSFYLKVCFPCFNPCLNAAKKDATIGTGVGWERFDFDKDAPVDDEEVEGQDLFPRPIVTYKLLLLFLSLLKQTKSRTRNRISCFCFHVTPAFSWFCLIYSFAFSMSQLVSICW